MPMTLFIQSVRNVYWKHNSYDCFFGQKSSKSLSYKSCQQKLDLSMFLYIQTTKGANQSRYMPSLISNFVYVLDSLLQISTIMILSFRTDRSGQTVKTQIRLLIEEQSDQSLHCLLFYLHLFDKIPEGLASLFEF